MMKITHIMMGLFILILIPTIAQADEIGTCLQEWPYNISQGTRTESSCRSTIQPLAQQHSPTDHKFTVVEVTPTFFSYYPKANLNEARLGRWNRTATLNCPSGQHVEYVPGTGSVCVDDPPPINPCEELQGDPVENIQVEFNRNSPNREADTLVKDGCKVNITSSGDVCIGLGANPDTITCFFSGTYTGEEATTGGEPVQQGTPPQNPQNPIVQEGTTENPAPNQVLQKGDQILEYQSEGLTYTVTETREGDVLTTTTTKTNESGQVVQTIRVVERVTAPTVTNVYNVSGGTAGGGGVSVSSGGSTQTGGGSSTTTSGTTTYPDGSENSTCEGDDCEGDGDGDGIPDNEGATEYTQANCNSVPWCKGDVIQCAQAREAWRTMCEVRNQAESIFGTEQERAAAQQQLTNEAQSVDTVEEMQEKVGITELNVGDLADFNTQLIPSGSSACPGDIIVPVWGNSFAVSFAPLCSLADSVRPLLLLFAYISAAIILYRALGNR